MERSFNSRWDITLIMSTVFTALFWANSEQLGNILWAASQNFGSTSLDQLLAAIISGCGYCLPFFFYRDRYQIGFKSIRVSNRSAANNASKWTKSWRHHKAYTLCLSFPKGRPSRQNESPASNNRSFKNRFLRQRISETARHARDSQKFVSVVSEWRVDTWTRGVGVTKAERRKQGPRKLWGSEKVVT